ncbi:3-oxoacyl-[acyl-carrier-protein] reductase FabG [bioreactor metagenome]|uniref:3-oxoacyl-[acyl-carrier-protein] reductase FabG n=1 Tax=bioreactor metagenome TaxID=1076179 RepID=A0A645BLE5_9ZZZZ
MIAPGPVATELFKQASPPDAAQTKALLAAVPLQRVSEPEEIAHAIDFLLHPLSGFITGQTLHIDGGLTISATRI